MPNFKYYAGWSNAAFSTGYTVGSDSSGTLTLTHTSDNAVYLQVIGKTLYKYDRSSRVLSRSTNLSTPSWTSVYTATTGGNALMHLSGSGSNLAFIYSSDNILLLSTNNGSTFGQVSALGTSMVYDHAITSTRLYVLRGTGTTSPSGFYAIDLTDLTTLKNQYFYRGYDSLISGNGFQQCLISVVEGGGVGGKDLVYIVGSKASDGVTRTVHKSVDSGATFTELTLPGGFGTKIYSVYAPNINDLYIGGAGTLAYSTNQGSTISSMTVGSTTYANVNIYPVSRSEVLVQSAIISYSSANDISYVYKANTTGTPSYSTLQSTTTSGSTMSSVYALTGVLDNEPPYGISLSASSIAENSASGTVVGALSASDYESQAVTFAMESGNGTNDADNSKFTIVGNNLQVASGAVLNYEAQTSCNILVKATDAAGAISYRTFSIAITNQPDAPNNILLSSNSIAENNSINDVIGTLSATDDDSSTFTFSIVSGSDKFNISGNQLRASVVFDYETATSHSVTIRATDSTSLTYDKVFTINILDGMDPIDIATVNYAVLSSGAVVLTIAADPTANLLQYNGQSLPNGSLVKNSITGQKFIKISGGATSYQAIELSPKVDWSWSASGSIVWQNLQNI
jgi:hypothetical protein